MAMWRLLLFSSHAVIIMHVNAGAGGRREP